MAWREVIEVLLSRRHSLHLSNLHTCLRCRTLHRCTSYTFCSLLFTFVQRITAISSIYLFLHRDACLPSFQHLFLRTISVHQFLFSIFYSLYFYFYVSFVLTPFTKLFCVLIKLFSFYYTFYLKMITFIKKGKSKSLRNSNSSFYQFVMVSLFECWKLSLVAFMDVTSWDTHVHDPDRDSTKPTILDRSSSPLNSRSRVNETLPLASGQVNYACSFEVRRPGNGWPLEDVVSKGTHLFVANVVHSW